MKLMFSTPGAFGPGICAASFGFSDAPNPQDLSYREFPIELSHALVIGSYDEVLSNIPTGNYQAGIVLLGNAGGEDQFVQSLAEKVRCPLTGGTAAINPKSGEKSLIFGRSQATVYLFQDNRYQITVESKNIHEEILGVHEVVMESPRVFASIDGEAPLAWYNKQRVIQGIPETDFEHLTFSDQLGINTHLSVVGGKLCSGKDLESTMILRKVSVDRVFPQMEEFYNEPNTIVFGCAGLKEILPQPLMTSGCGLFLFGEVVSINGISRFGNLMVSKICVSPK